MKKIDFSKLVKDNDVEFCFSNGYKFKASDVKYSSVEMMTNSENVPIDKLFETLTGAEPGTFSNLPIIELRIAMDELYKHFFGESPSD